MKYLVVPIHVDALLLTESLTVRHALADFRKLPYTDGTQDHNPGTPYVGASITSQPLEQPNLHLNAGVHLHWVLPAALRKTVESSSPQGANQGTHYPAVPDRWLINRKKGDTIEKTWVVESNYISKNQSVDQGNLGAVNVPFHDDESDNRTQPFRFMGRSRDVSGDSEGGEALFGDGENYLHEVTAIGFNPEPRSKGHGEPTFSAFYPNCSSVFGFYDPEVTEEDELVTYEVLGLYSNSDKDYFKHFITNFSEENDGKEDFFELLNEQLASACLFRVKGESDPAHDLINNPDAIPQSAGYFGKTVPQLTCNPEKDHIEFFMGNTSTEALSAYLASKLESEEADSSRIEEQLEAVQFSSFLENRALDIGHKFKEARHRKGFTAVDSGFIWLVKNERKSDSETAADEEITLNNDLALTLNEINLLQDQYDQMLVQIVELRRQLFSDWNKYMIAAYPEVDNEVFFFDHDELMGYMRQQSIHPLRNAMEEMGQLFVSYNDQGAFSIASAEGPDHSIAYRLATKLNELQTAIQEISTDQYQLTLRQSAAPRYWQPNEPVVLLAEEKVDDSCRLLENPRYPAPGQSQLVSCKLMDLPVDLSNLTVSTAKEAMEAVSALYAEMYRTGNHLDDGIWNPFYMEWEAEYLPVLEGNNYQLRNRKYTSAFFTKNHELKETDPDFSIRDQVVFGNASLFKGSSIIAPHTTNQLDALLDQFINNHEDKQSEVVNEVFAKAKTLLENSNTAAHVLGGFNEAMLGQIQQRQLDVADPLGFPPYQAFAQEVAPFIGNTNITSPDPLLDFNPLRSGSLRLLNLRLVDTFGRSIDFDLQEGVNEELFLKNSEPLKLGESSSFAHLAPRITQPARLNFRFLSASYGEQETTSHPASTPICGWLLPNNLDQSIACYDQDGAAVGSLTMSAANSWKPAPNSAGSGNITSIKNVHLRRVITYLFDKQQAFIEGSTDEEIDTSNSFLSHFLNALNGAQENIAPENFAEHLDLALLMGKPLAVVRMKFGFQLAGAPKKDQSWTDLIHQLRGRGRSSHDFTKVEIPIRLGEFQQFNDGLYGYWVESENGELNDTYFSSEAGQNDDPHIATYAEGGDPLTIKKTIDDEPTCVTALVDPRGSIHAVSGVLPVKSIQLPKDQYTDALKNISVTFLTAPVISPARDLKVSLPEESGFQWDWVQRTTDQKWHQIAKQTSVSKALFLQQFADQPQIWDDLVRLVWLVPFENNEGQAVITSEVQRAFPPNEEGVSPLHYGEDVAQRIDAFFDAYGERIEPFDLKLRIGDPQIIREGWLKLSQQEETPTVELSENESR